MIFQALPIFDHAHPINNKLTFGFHKLVSGSKKEPNLSVHISDQADFKVRKPERISSFFITTIQKW